MSPLLLKFVTNNYDTGSDTPQFFSHPLANDKKSWSEIIRNFREIFYPNLSLFGSQEKLKLKIIPLFPLFLAQ